MIKDPIKRISVHEWEDRINEIPESYHEKCTFLRDIIPGGVKYLFSPLEYSCKGDKLLGRLKFDSSPASLRLWAFLFSEKDRLFLAKNSNWKIFATMKDLGQVPIITYAFPKALTFYADELWWAPCFAEESYLLDEASDLGATEELCYVRAALGAYKTLDYFPKPDLSFAGVGSCCDDFSAVMQLIEWQGNPIHWWEIPMRLDNNKNNCHRTFKKSHDAGSHYQKEAVTFLSEQYQGIVDKLNELGNTNIGEKELSQSVKQFNKIRKLVQDLRELVYSAERPPIPGLEMLLAEFIAIHACSELNEAPLVLEDLLETARKRLANNESPFGEKPLRIFWASPPTDASIITYVEDKGGCIAGTEYLISHAFYQLDENKSPLEAIAENYMDDPMIGSSDFRAERIVSEAKKFGAEGVLITGIFGASHCAFEERIISEKVREKLDIPVLSFDVPYSPGQMNEQVANRLDSFIELLEARR